MAVTCLKFTFNNKIRRCLQICRKTIRQSTYSSSQFFSVMEAKLYVQYVRLLFWWHWFKTLQHRHWCWPFSFSEADVLPQNTLQDVLLHRLRSGRQQLWDMLVQTAHRLFAAGKFLFCHYCSISELSTDQSQDCRTGLTTSESCMCALMYRFS